MIKAAYYINTRDFDHKYVKIENFEDIQKHVKGRFERQYLNESHDIIFNEEFLSLYESDVDADFKFGVKYHNLVVLGPYLIAKHVNGKYVRPDAKFVNFFLKYSTNISLQQKPPA